MEQTDTVAKNIFGVIARGQTYLNLLYNLLAFPLGLFYFIVLIVGLSVGIGTVIIWIGLLILALMLGAWWLFILFERQLASGMLKVKLGVVDTPKTQSAQTIWKKIGAYLSNPVTWKGLLFLFLKFPFGLVVFVVLVTLGSIVLYLLTAPVTYQFFCPEVWFTFNTYWKIDTLSDAMIAFVISVPLIFVTLHVSNGLAWVSGWLAKVLLGNPVRETPPAPAMAGKEQSAAPEINPAGAGESQLEENTNPENSSLVE